MAYKLVPLARIADICGGFAFKSADLGTAGFPVVKIANIQPPRVNLHACERVSPAKIVGLDKFRLRNRDIVMAMTGATIGKAGRVRTDDSIYLNQRVAKISAKAGNEFDDFIFALVSQQGFDMLVLNNASGSAQANVSADGIGRILVPELSPDEQLQIGRTIAALDDKVELNRWMNETLEATARVIFKSWFVDFDPVRVKAEGRQPFGMDAETTALFPDSFQDSALGKIPKSWDVRSIGDVVTIVGGSTPRTDQPGFWDGKVNFATPKDMSPLRTPILLETERRITESGVQQISSGLLPKGTVLLSSRAPIGYLAIAEVPVTVNQGIIAMICDKELPNLYVLQWTKENLDTIIANANGTTFLEISKSNFRPIKALVPPAPVLSQFLRIVEPLYRRMLNNVIETNTLAAIRDALLPKLISGEIRVKDTEKMVGEKV
jgi:type I restriction enzyme S subunit